MTKNTMFGVLGGLPGAPGAPKALAAKASVTTKNVMFRTAAQGFEKCILFSRKLLSSQRRRPGFSVFTAS
jgi:hypothetical protein